MFFPRRFLRVTGASFLFTPSLALTAEPVRLPISYVEERILVPVQIAGIGERYFILDTAAGGTVISAGLRARLDLAPDAIDQLEVQGVTDADLDFQAGVQPGFVQFNAMLEGEPVAAVLDSAARIGTLNWHAAGLTGLSADSEAVTVKDGGSRGIDGHGTESYTAPVGDICQRGLRGFRDPRYPDKQQ